MVGISELQHWKVTTADAHWDEIEKGDKIFVKQVESMVAGLLRERDFLLDLVDDYKLARLIISSLFLLVSLY